MGFFTPFFAVPDSLDEELAEEGFPLDPENPGSPYLPLSDLDQTQVKPSLDFTHRFAENHQIKAGLTANFISADQDVSIFDLGGGGGLPNPRPSRNAHGLRGEPERKLRAASTPATRCRLPTTLISTTA